MKVLKINDKEIQFFIEYMRVPRKANQNYGNSWLSYNCDLTIVSDEELNDYEREIIARFISHVVNDNDMGNEIETLKKENKELVEQLEEYKLQNVSLRADVMIKKMALPNELIKDKTFYDLYDMPTYEELLTKIDKSIKYINKKLVSQGGFTSYEWNELLSELLLILKGE